MKNRFIVILAGGNGERLWPLSRSKKPKQLLPIAEQCSLLEKTIQRVHTLVDKEQLWIVTTQVQYATIKDLVGDSVGSILVEPDGRNTAAAIGYTCLKIYKQDPNAVVSFLPADHFIKQEKKFVATLAKALAAAESSKKIILLGVKPQWAAPGYGYIEYNDDEKNDICPVVKFHEKPTQKTAQWYASLPNMLWNTGIFCAQVTLFIEEYRRHVPQLLHQLEHFMQSGENYAMCPAISIDHAIIENSHYCSVIPADFEWSDVGNIATFLNLLQDNNHDVGQVIQVNAINNLIQAPNKLVALVDVHDLCVVETSDVLLITKRDQTDQVKKIVTILKDRQYEQYL